MNKVIFLVLITFLILACGSDKASNTLVFSGEIENANSLGLVLSKGEFEQSIPVDQEGSFEIELTGVKEGIYELWDSAEYTRVYLIPGKDLVLNMNVEEFDESISFSGPGSRGSNYLAAKYLFEEAQEINFRDLYSSSEQEFMEKIGQFENEKLNFLNSVDSLPELLISMEKKTFHYEKMSLISNYESAHSYFTQKKDFKATPEFLEPLNSVDYNNEEDFKSINAYQQLVLSHYSTGSIMNDIEKLDGISSDLIKKDVVQYLTHWMRPGSEQLDEIFEGLSKHISDETQKADLVSLYEKFLTLKKGMPSPTFSYPSVDGTMISLEDLRGKIVYIDVWATWCGPCIAEIPDLKALEEEFRNDEVAFVSISIDKSGDKPKWIEMIQDKELRGIQLFADNDWNSEFVQSYGISGIPRFILVDKEGKIIDADAPRPSSGEEIWSMIKSQL